MDLNLSGKNYVILLRNLPFASSKSSKPSKRGFIFLYFSAVFEKAANLLRQELLFNHILKECLNLKDLQTIIKEAGTVLISLSVCLSCNAENFTVMCLGFVAHQVQHTATLKKTRQQFKKPSCLNFSS